MSIADIIDHTILKPELPFGVYTEGVRDCVTHNFASFCVNPQFVKLVSNLLRNHPECRTVPCSVIGFPFGASLLSTKVTELNAAIADGAKEIDFVQNIAAVKTGDWKRVRDDYQMLRNAAKDRA